MSDQVSNPVCCIEDRIKSCLDNLVHTVSCDRNTDWCIPQEVNENLCGINIKISSESQDGAISTNIGRGAYFKNKAWNAELEIEIYALSCSGDINNPGAKRKAKSCLTEINQLMFKHAREFGLRMMEYTGFDTDTDQQGGAQYALLTASYEISYIVDLSSANVLKV